MELLIPVNGQAVVVSASSHETSPPSGNRTPSMTRKVECGELVPILDGVLWEDDVELP